MNKQFPGVCVKSFIVLCLLFGAPVWGQSVIDVDDSGVVIEEVGSTIYRDAPDAGEVDAGVLDAGTRDAGPAEVVEEGDPKGLAKTVVASAKAGDWSTAIAALVMLGAWAIRKWGKDRFPFLGTDRGGVATVVVLTLIGTLASTLHQVGAAGMSPDVVSEALKVAALSIGGYTGMKKMLFPSDAPVKAS